MTRQESSTYKDAGVDLDKANQIPDEIKEIVQTTYTEGVVGEIGGFCSSFDVTVPEGAKNIRLRSSTDGVGTKLKVANMVGKHDTVGIDMVAMCVNDILVSGAKPLFFLNYYALENMDLAIVKEIVTGTAEGCRQAKCALIGGETAELPGMIVEDEYDIAGFAVGMDMPYSLTEQKANIGDKLICLPSSGLHSNGFSLVRKILFEDNSFSVDEFIGEFGKTLGEELLEPTIIYVDQVLSILKISKVNAIVNVTGGGVIDNIPRSIQGNMTAVIKRGSWPIPPIFSFLNRLNPLPEIDQMQTFNGGIGMILMASEDQCSLIETCLNERGEEYYYIGEIREKQEGEESVVFID